MAQGVSAGLRDDLDGRDGGGQWESGREIQQRGVYVCTQLIHFAVQQKLRQYCKATPPQLQNRQKKKQKQRRKVQGGMESGEV